MLLVSGISPLAARNSFNIEAVSPKSEYSLVRTTGIQLSASEKALIDGVIAPGLSVEPNKLIADLASFMESMEYGVTPSMGDLSIAGDVDQLRAYEAFQLLFIKYLSNKAIDDKERIADHERSYLMRAFVDSVCANRNSFIAPITLTIPDDDEYSGYGVEALSTMLIEYYSQLLLDLNGVFKAKDDPDEAATILDLLEEFKNHMFSSKVQDEECDSFKEIFDIVFRLSHREYEESKLQEAYEKFQDLRKGYINYEHAFEYAETFGFFAGSSSQTSDGICEDLINKLGVDICYKLFVIKDYLGFCPSYLRTIINECFPPIFKFLDVTDAAEADDTENCLILANEVSEDLTELVTKTADDWAYDVAFHQEIACERIMDAISNAGEDVDMTAMTKYMEEIKKVVAPDRDNEPFKAKIIEMADVGVNVCLNQVSYSKEFAKEFPGMGNAFEHLDVGVALMPAIVSGIGSGRSSTDKAVSIALSEDRDAAHLTGYANKVAQMSDDDKKLAITYPMSVSLDEEDQSEYHLIYSELPYTFGIDTYHVYAITDEDELVELDMLSEDNSTIKSNFYVESDNGLIIHFDSSIKGLGLIVLDPLKAINETIASLKKQIKALRDSLSSDRPSASKRKDNVEGISKKIKDLTAELEALEGQNDNLDDRIKEALKAIKRISSEVNSYIKGNTSAGILAALTISFPVLLVILLIVSAIINMVNDFKKKSKNRK